MRGSRIVLVEVYLLVCCLSSCLAGEIVTKRRAIEPLPSEPCSTSNQGEVWTSSQGTPVSTIWICQDGRWIPHQVTPSTGKTQQVAGKSCKDVRDTLTTDCSGPPPTGTYWINITDSCDGEQDSMRVYCEMSLNGGGWTLVWKHSYMEVGPLSENMKYFSNHNRPCTDIETGWCNVPNKARLNPTEMMIVAYRNKGARFAYKGWFNYNIDHNWRGGILVEPKKILDQCRNNINIVPAPSTDHGDRRLLGIAFDKRSPTNYLKNCVTILGQFPSAGNCRWADCDGWDHSSTQMTMAIYVR